MPEEKGSPYSDPLGAEGSNETPASPPFITPSLQQAAFLFARGFPVTVQLQKGNNSNRCEFVFARTEPLLDSVLGFDTKTIAVGHSEYEKARKQICRLIGDVKREAQ